MKTGRKNIEIIFEDDDLLILNKPAGILTLPDRFHPGTFNLRYFLEKKYGKILVVHRLDAETSGLISFAKTEAAHRHLSQQFESRAVHKSYLALVEGALREKEGTIDQPIAAHPGKSGMMIINPKGKKAVSRYRVLEEFKHYSLLDIEIETGRTHQIRVHLQHIGHPLAVDPLYGRRKELFLSHIKSKGYHLSKGKQERPLIDRCTLHASQLALRHPTGGRAISFEAPLPKDLKALINQLRKWGDK